MTPSEKIESLILTLRGHRVILDSDLAALYGVSTKRLNEQVKRNRKRFPSDFLIQLNKNESQFVHSLRSQNATLKNKQISRSQNATLKWGHNIKYLPYAFTEYGAFMAANVLNSPRAVSMSVYVIRAFVRIREAIAFHHIFEKRLAGIEKNLMEHDQALRELFSRIKPLLLPPPEKTKRRIGFHSHAICI